MDTCDRCGEEIDVEDEDVAIVCVECCGLWCSACAIESSDPLCPCADNDDE